MTTARDAAQSTTSEATIAKIRLAVDMIAEDTRDPMAESLAIILRDNAMILLETIRRERTSETLVLDTSKEYVTIDTERWVVPIE